MSGELEFDPEDVVRALLTGDRFWKAVAGDDDDALAGLLASAPLAALLERRGGLASGIRSHRRFTPQDCRDLGIFNRLSVLPGRRMRLSYGFVGDGRVRHVAAGEPVEGWRLELAFDEGRWTVDPFKEHTEPAIAAVTIGRP